MSQQDAQIVWRSCEAWEQGDTARWLATLHPDVVWDSSHFGGWEEASVFRGRDQVRSFLVNEWRASWNSYEARVEQLFDAGDRVLVLWSQRMVGADPGGPITVKSAQICSVNDGKIIRMDNYADRREALKAVGLEE
jgi:ketosteroid isomerase-like protein